MVTNLSSCYSMVPALVSASACLSGYLDPSLVVLDTRRRAPE